MGAAGGMYGSIASGLISAVGTLHQTEAEIADQKYQEQVAEYNKYMAIQTGEAVAQDIESQTGQAVGTQAARARAGGVTLEGSPLQVMADTAAAGQLKAERARFSAHVAATGWGDKQNMAHFNQYFLRWNKFNRAGGAFVSSFLGSGGAGNSLMAAQGTPSIGGGIG